MSTCPICGSRGEPSFFGFSCTRASCSNFDAAFASTEALPARYTRALRTRVIANGPCLYQEQITFYRDGGVWWQGQGPAEVFPALSALPAPEPGDVWYRWSDEEGWQEWIRT